ncbi:hypothetical protein KCM76_09860 [Zooshikella marina]|uniref:hypothetical protein n=1 Tax=Zooshikella ganghwensis TaxID=202772 RepID=UPI001BAF11BC|nr:hypothetical protein [Zooshikella ganghwensis]MBU2706293.1 hypothetical protein [Zooshikella ganghwensis]
MTLLAGCGSQPFRVENLAKSDTDFVADTVRAEMRKHLATLMEKLYKRNPRELYKSGATIKQRQALLFDHYGPIRLPELKRKASTDAILLAFDDSFNGDRVMAVMAGLTDMIRQSYDYHDEFFILDELNQQKLYNSARNLEILAWRLQSRKTPSGKPYLITNSLQQDAVNLSFERLFGKMIMLQDMMAQIVSSKNDRTINFLVRGVATTTFLPI